MVKDPSLSLEALDQFWLTSESKGNDGEGWGCLPPRLPNGERESMKSQSEKPSRSAWCVGSLAALLSLSFAHLLEEIVTPCSSSMNYGSTCY